MAFNIVELVKGRISDRMLGRLGDAVGMDGTQTSIAMGGALPGLLGGLAGAAERPGGASALLDGIRGADDSLLGGTDAMLDEGRGDELAERGGSLLDSLLGRDATAKLAGALGSFTGLGGAKGGSLLGMLAPVVVGALKGRVADDGLDADGFGSMLSSQRANIDAAMPEGFADTLRSEGFFDSIGAGEPAPATRTDGPTAPPLPGAAEPAPPGPAPAPRSVETNATPAPAPASEREGGSGGLPKWVIPVAALVVLGALALFLLGGGDEDNEAVVAVTDTADGIEADADDADAVTATAASASAGVSAEAMAAASAALPEGLTMDGLTGDVESVFSSTTEALEGVTDEASAEAAVPALQDASDRLGNFVGLFRRLPDAAQGPLRQILGQSETSLRPIVDTALDIPGAEPVLRPVLDPMLEQLEGLSEG